MYLGHSWSLAVEEQFYLLWPLVLLPVLRVGGKRAAFRLSLVLLLASLAWLQWLSATGSTTERMYNGFDTRIGGLLVGCAMALAGKRLPSALAAGSRVPVWAVAAAGAVLAQLTDGRTSSVHTLPLTCSW